MKYSHVGNEARKECYNFESLYSVVIRGIVAADNQFLWASFELLGSVNDVCPFQTRNLYHSVNRGRKQSETYKTINKIKTLPQTL